MQMVEMTPQMKKMLVIVGIVFSLIFGWYVIKKVFFWYFISHYEPPPVTISSTTANAHVWQSFLTSVGSLTAVNGVAIRPIC
jgi:membrane fusion protein (multidrug efflux system)